MFIKRCDERCCISCKDTASLSSISNMRDMWNPSKTVMDNSKWSLNFSMSYWELFWCKSNSFCKKRKVRIWIVNGWGWLIRNIVLHLEAASREWCPEGRRRTTSCLSERFMEGTLQVDMERKWSSLGKIYGFSVCPYKFSDTSQNRIEQTVVEVADRRDGKVWQLLHQKVCIHSVFSYYAILFDPIYVSKPTIEKKKQNSWIDKQLSINL
jgi:hypothetical protein